MRKKYKLIGFINIIDTVPSFVIPIFQREGMYYTGVVNGKKLIIEFFAPLKESAWYKIVYLDKVENNLQNIVEMCTDSKPLFAFQSTKDYVFFGRIREMRKYLKNYETDDEMLREDIDYLFNVAGSKA